MTKCKDCETPINDDDRRWNKNPNTVYCRECVHEPVLNASAWLKRAKVQEADAQRIYEEEKAIAKEKMGESSATKKVGWRELKVDEDSLVQQLQEIERSSKRAATVAKAMEVATRGDGKPRDLSWMEGDDDD